MEMAMESTCGGPMRQLGARGQVKVKVNGRAYDCAYLKSLKEASCK